MKRIKAGCVLQTLIFLQKEDCGLSPELQLKYNRQEVEKYKADMDRRKTRYQILDVTEQSDSSIIVHVKKQMSDTVRVGEYFE